MANKQSKAKSAGSEGAAPKKNLEDRKFVDQPETTPEVVEKGHKAKVEATDATRVNMDDLNGDNIIEKLTDNPVARSNREVAKLGTAEASNAQEG